MARAKVSGMDAPLNLNLVRVFVAIYETRSVGTAGDRLRLTQPTISYGLSKLRAALHDQLFVRVGNGMTPTPRADQIYGEFLASLRRIDQAVDQLRKFHPATSQRLFVLALSDIGEMAFLPPILEKLRADAPGVVVQVVQTTADDLRRGLSTGDIAAAVGNLPTLLRLKRKVLFEEHYVSLVSVTHPAASVGWTVTSFNAARHAHVASGASGHGQIAEWLDRAGLLRAIALDIPHFAVLPRVVANSDLVALVPSSVAVLFERYEDVVAVALPIELPKFEVNCHWHKNDETNTANNWFRKTVIKALSTLSFQPVRTDRQAARL